MIQTVIEKKRVVLFPIPDMIDDEVVEVIKTKTAKMKISKLKHNASVSLNEEVKFLLQKEASAVVEEINLWNQELIMYLEKQY